ncbi:MAG: hypothetical protein M3071_08155 [Actinomycetota bacterium]|nr:hypothetical protein [Actinomycetota bacterium]
MPLRDHFQAEALADVDDRLREGRFALPAGTETVHKRLGDLEDVDR